jgi:hypothetical protein
MKSGQGQEILFFSKSSTQPPLYIGYSGSVPGCKAAGGGGGSLKFTTDLPLLLRSCIFALPVRLDGVYGENFVSFTDDLHQQ